MDFYSLRYGETKWLLRKIFSFHHGRQVTVETIKKPYKCREWSKLCYLTPILSQADRSMVLNLKFRFGNRGLLLFNSSSELLEIENTTPVNKNGPELPISNTRFT